MSKIGQFDLNKFVDTWLDKKLSRTEFNHAYDPFERVYSVVRHFSTYFVLYQAIRTLLYLNISCQWGLTFGFSSGGII